MTDKPEDPKQDENYVYLFDTTLRDGAQMQGVDFSVPDKIAISTALDAIGLDYIEGGWPGANPTDDAFFADPPDFQRARFSAETLTSWPDICRTWRINVSHWGVGDGALNRGARPAGRAVLKRLVGALGPRSAGCM